MSFIRLRRVIFAVLLPAVVVACAEQAPARSQPRSPDVIYIPTPPALVEAMLTLAQVSPDDIVYDLGSGDGRIPIAAVLTFNARAAVGIEIDPKRIREANANLKKAIVSDRVHFLNRDLFTTPIGDATVVTLYLVQSLNERLMPKLQKELKPGPASCRRPSAWARYGPQTRRFKSRDTTSTSGQSSRTKWE